MLHGGLLLMWRDDLSAAIWVGCLLLKWLSVCGSCHLTQTVLLRNLFAVFNYSLLKLGCVFNCLLKMVGSQLLSWLRLANYEAWSVVLLQNLHVGLLGGPLLRMRIALALVLLLFALDFGVAVGSALCLMTIWRFWFFYRRQKGLYILLYPLISRLLLSLELALQDVWGASDFISLC